MKYSIFWKVAVSSSRDVWINEIDWKERILSELDCAHTSDNLSHDNFVAYDICFYGRARIWRHDCRTTFLFSEEEEIATFD